MTNLFADDFPVAKNDDDLAKIQKKFPKYDPYYIASGAILGRSERFEKLYAKFYPYQDSHFLSQVKCDFNARTWEMYLACVFIENGFKISSENVGPDIKIVFGDKTIWIECVAPKKGDGDDSVPDLLYDGSVQDLPERKMLLRMTSKLADKFRVYEKYIREGIVQKDDIFVIALNRSGLDHFDPGIPLILKALFGMEYLNLPIRPMKASSEDRWGKPFWSKRKDVVKTNGEPISVNFFEDEAHSGISAVIYSKNSVLSHPEKIGSDCILVHNPLAENKLSVDVFPFLEQYEDQGDKIVKL